MQSSPLATAFSSTALPKARTGISGFDDITYGGLPAGRPTLLCGDAGCGKTLFSMTFLVNGIRESGEPGVFMSLEETPPDLAANTASLGYDIPQLVADRQLVIDHVEIERSEIEEAGEYDLEGLFVRLEFAIGSVGAKRVVLDTLETLFAGLSDTAILRAELRRLFAWLKRRNVTTIITAERGDGALTRHGLEEYVSDCVILLDNRVHEQVTTRRLRVVKYRGSEHGINEYPFLIDGQGISVLPLTSAGLGHAVSDAVAPTGISGLDAMLGAGGFFRGSSVLVSGSAGTGKSLFAVQFAHAACSRGERCLYFAFEESAAQIIRNARSVGLDLQPLIDAGLLQFDAARPSLCGFEMHLTRMHRAISQFTPTMVVVDPISAFRGPQMEVHSTLLRIIDIVKGLGITGLFIQLDYTENYWHTVQDRGVSSLMDTWISLMDIEASGERNHGLYIRKARGMSSSNQIREYRIQPGGLALSDVYLGTDGMLTGSARVAQQARNTVEARHRERERERKRRDIARKRQQIEQQIAEMLATVDAEERELQALFDEESADSDLETRARHAVATSRGVAE